MAVKRATLEIESTGQAAHYETDPIAADGQLWNVPALIIEVQDFDEALEIVDTLNRSRAQKKRERKPAEPTLAPEEKKADQPDLHLAGGKTGAAKS